MGYMVFIALQIIFLAFVCYFIGAMVSLALTAFLFGFASFKDIKTILKSINRHVKLRKNQQKNRKQIIDYDTVTYDIHHFDNKVNQFKIHLIVLFFFSRLINVAIEVTQPIFMALFTLVTICGTLLMLQMEIV